MSDFDALCRRIQTITNGSTTRYYYDGWRVLRETDQNQAAQRYFAYGSYLDEAALYGVRPGVKGGAKV